MGCARWKGARLKDLLDKAGLKKEAIEIAFDGADSETADGHDIDEAEVEIAATAESGDSTYDPTLESTYERSSRPWEDV